MPSDKLTELGIKKSKSGKKEKKLYDGQGLYLSFVFAPGFFYFLSP